MQVQTLSLNYNTKQEYEQTLKNVNLWLDETDRLLKLHKNWRGK